MNKSAKEHYRTYLADNSLSELSGFLIHEILKEKPVHAFEFGCGTGKHLAELRKQGVVSAGLDISLVNILHAAVKNENKLLMLGDENLLRNLCNFDVVFTCSVMDHIPQETFHDIMDELKRISNKSVILAETQDCPGMYYYKHNYEQIGFKKMDYTWKSHGDGATYHIWKWIKPDETPKKK